MTDRFKKRVISHLKREGWSIKYTAISPIDFFSVRPHTHTQKAYRVKPHGHLTHNEQKALYNYGKQTGIHVIYIHETAGRDLEFIRLYPKTLKTEAI
jgi:hypothetical protein